MSDEPIDVDRLIAAANELASELRAKKELLLATLRPGGASPSPRVISPPDIDHERSESNHYSNG
jgi:hypothetical protein